MLMMMMMMMVMMMMLINAVTHIFGFFLSVCFKSDKWTLVRNAYIILLFNLYQKLPQNINQNMCDI